MLMTFWLPWVHEQWESSVLVRGLMSEHLSLEHFDIDPNSNLNCILILLTTLVWPCPSPSLCPSKVD